MVRCEVSTRVREIIVPTFLQFIRVNDVLTLRISGDAGVSH